MDDRATANPMQPTGDEAGREADQQSRALDWLQDEYLLPTEPTLDGPEREPGSAYVQGRSGFWAAHAAETLEREDRVDEAIAMLSGGACTSPEWSYVWGQLWKLRRGDDALVSMAHDWLRDSSVLYWHWPSVWLALQRDALDDDDLLVRASDWLFKDTDRHKLWGTVWAVAESRLPHDERRAVLAWAWLQQQFKHPTWPIVWKGVAARRPGDTQVIAVGERWLKETSMDNPRWGFFWTEFVRRAGSRPDILDLGRTFASGPPPHRQGVARVVSVLRATEATALGKQPRKDLKEWAARWAAHFDEGRPYDRLCAKGRAWLPHSMDERLWASVFLRLWQDRSLRAELSPLGHAWLEQHASGRRAAEVREVLGIAPVPRMLAKNAQASPVAPIQSVPAQVNLEALASLVVGGQRTGTVQNVVPFGVFVAIGDDIVGLLHRSQLLQHEIDNLTSEFRQGQTLRVEVDAVDIARGRVGLRLVREAP